MSKADFYRVIVMYLCLASGIGGVVWGMVQEKTYRVMYGVAVMLVGIGGLFGRSSIAFFFFALGAAMWLAGTMNRRKTLARRSRH